MACLEVPPDLARFTVRVSSRHADRRTALEVLSARSDGVREVIDGAGEAVEKRESGGLHLWPAAEPDGIPAYAGSVTTSVVVNDFGVLGDLMVRLALLEQCHVAGPFWQLRPDSEHAAEARRAAVRDGLRRARQYADSLGAKIDSLVDLTDDGPQPAPIAPPGADPGEQHPELPSFDVELRPLTVQAEVRLRVRITSPNLSQ